MPIAHLAFDLGASSGRAILGLLNEDTGELTLEEVHRFEHLACATPAGPVWDLTGIWRNLLTGLGKAGKWCRANGTELKTVGVDTWGVDWTLVGESGEVLLLPHCYRDPQNDVAAEKVVQKLGGFEQLYKRSGIQKMSFNTLFQVAARHEHEPKLFDAAKRLLFLPDLFHFWLSGELSNERTIASTSSMLDAKTQDWDKELVESLGLPTNILGNISDSGTKLGTLRAEVAESAGVDPSIQIILPASHDTASAVAAVPASKGNDWAYLSSGTWSLLGAELDEPILTDEALSVPFTNELGVQGTVRFLKNIAGLWLIQELRRDLHTQGIELNFSELMTEARQAETGGTLIDPNNAMFAEPNNMKSKIKKFALETNQAPLETVGQIARCCLESLSLCYAQTLDGLEKVTKRKVKVLHIVGGGIQNHFLSDLTASATNCAVTAGPVEATAIGNLLVQAIGCGKLSNVDELRQVVKKSFPPTEVESRSDIGWDQARAKFSELTK